MGMSASQARLLSITARLTNNEFRSQTITNSKLRLAEKSSEASQEYMDALNTQQLMFGVYDDNGNYTKQDLTPALIYDYAPLKNQYALINTAGKMLVSNKDAKNFENTNSLHEFLDCYGLVEDFVTTEDVEVTNPAWTAWVTEHEKWEKSEPKQEDYKKTTTETVTTRVNTSPIYPALTSTIATCFNIAIGGENCFMHVLSALIGVGEHTTSSGETFKVSYTEDTCDEHGHGWCWNTYARHEEIGDTLRQSLYTDTLSTEAFDGEVVTDYGTVKCTGSGDDTNLYGNNVYQKIVDFLWDIHEEYVVGTSTGGTANPNSLAKFFYLIEFDLGESTTETEIKETIEDDVDGYNEAHKKWEESEPGEPPKTIIEKQTNTLITINDKDKAQWYVNLWYYMNGSETANKVKQKEITDAETNVTSNIFVVEGAAKSGKGGTYEVFEDLSLYKSSDWLQFALEHGMVTMYQAQYNNPALDSGKVSELTSEGVTWTSIIYTNASDITQQDDETAIAIAEVKYKNAVTEIENKDKKYDQDLKKLDTEHSALQTEYDSIKEVIGKNVDRSFKAFS